MHDFFWEGCGFAKRGFKNTIAVSEAFDRLEAENAELKQKLKAEADKVIAELKKACNDKDDWCLHTLKENRHHKYKRCLEKAKTLDRDATISNFMIVTEKEDGQKENHKKKAAFYRKWSNKWLDLAEHYKEGI
jgi:hypothetical protein